MKTFDVVEASISELLAVLGDGEVTSVDLVCAYLNRIAYYDRTGQCLNSVPVLNPQCLIEAEASDARRRRGERLGPLEGVPFTVKDSYLFEGLSAAAGSEALRGFTATQDAPAVTLLRAAGAVLLGKTNMPPMAAGGVQPGLYDYARSPYNPVYLTAAYGSGSSNGSGTSTAASFGAFGMGAETVSSGRSPASNNALVAYTPSRGLISIRGNWPLRPSCDVVTPHTRTVEDMLRLLDVLVVESSEETHDFWRQQSAVRLPAVSEVVTQPFLRPRPPRLDGVRLGVPKMFIGQDSDSLEPPLIRDTVRALWERAAEDLRSLGADIVEVDFPLVSNYEEDRHTAQGLVERGLIPAHWPDIEGGAMTALALEEFLQDNANPELKSWADIDGDAVFPEEDQPVRVTVVRGRGRFDWQRVAELVKAGLPQHYDQIPGINGYLQGLEEARRTDFEDWMTALGLDGLVFPAAGDVARDDCFTRAESMDHACMLGVTYSNGGRAIRHLGVPTVNVPMGFMADTKMPVNLTFAGAAYSDDRLLDYAWAYEQRTTRRQRAFLTPSIPSNQVSADRAEAADESELPELNPRVTLQRSGGSWEVEAQVEAGAGTCVAVWADGHIMPADGAAPGRFRGRVSASRRRLEPEMWILTKITDASGASRASLQRMALD